MKFHSLSEYIKIMTENHSIESLAKLLRREGTPASSFCSKGICGAGMPTSRIRVIVLQEVRFNGKLTLH